MSTNEIESSKLIGNVLYGVPVEEMRSSYSQKEGCPSIYNDLGEGTLVDKIEGLPVNGVYLLEFEIMILGQTKDSIEVIRGQLAKEGKRFATLNEGLQFMIDGQNGRKVTNWERVFALGTVHERSGEGREDRYCYIHNNPDGLDYGSMPAIGLTPRTLLIVKSSVFVRASRAA